MHSMGDDDSNVRQNVAPSSEPGQNVAVASDAPRPSAEDVSASPFPPNKFVKWPKGVSANPSGRPKGLISAKKHFSEAFREVPRDGGESLTMVALRLARGVYAWKANPDTGERELVQIESKLQIEALKFCASYGIGLPAKRLDDETAAKIARGMVAEMLAEARAKAAAASALELEAIEVEPS